MTKKELREKYKKMRAEIPSEGHDFISRLLAGHLAAYFDLTGKSISCFMPIRRLHEPDTTLILDAIKAKFYLPVMDEEYGLKHIRYEGREFLKENSWGILEPITGQEIRANEFDFVLVPLLTIDEKGFRVGYGKGFYDQFLKECNSRCIFIGIYQFDTLEVIDDLHDADIPLHYCVSPKGIRSFV